MTILMKWNGVRASRSAAMNEIKIEERRYYLKRGATDGWVRLVLRTRPFVLYADFKPWAPAIPRPSCAGRNGPCDRLPAEVDAAELAGIDAVLRDNGVAD
jgi:hypothetical protein